MIVIKFKYLPTICQSQLDDFLGRKFVEKYDMNVPREHRAAHKKFRGWLPVHPYAPRARATTNPTCKAQRTLIDFLPKRELTSLPRMPYFGRFRSIPKTTYEDFAASVIPPMEWDILQAFPPHLSAIDPPAQAGILRPPVIARTTCTCFTHRERWMPCFVTLRAGFFPFTRHPPKGHTFR